MQGQGDVLREPTRAVDDQPVWKDPRVENGMRAQLAGLGDRPAGWKLGLGSAAAMELAGINGPLVSYLTASTQLEDTAEIDVAGWSNPVSEPEIAIFLGAPVAPDATRDEVAAAIVGLGGAIEIVDIDLPLSEVEQFLAGGIFHRHYLIGPPRAERAGAATDDLTISATLNGEEVARTEAPEAAVGNLIELVSFTARYLAPFGYGLEAGQFIISGSVVPPISLKPGDELVYEASGLGELRLSF